MSEIRKVNYFDSLSLLSVSDIRMSDAVPYNKNEGSADEVERCQCPAGYAGESCEVNRRNHVLS